MENSHQHDNENCNESNLPGYHSVEYKLTRQNIDINTVSKLINKSKKIWFGCTVCIKCY